MLLPILLKAAPGLLAPRPEKPSAASFAVVPGDVIGGTATMISRVPNLTVISVSTPLVALVTLARRK